ncbi:hypothetical protein ACHAPT_011236 [Fusarium lateritium]
MQPYLFHENLNRQFDYASDFLERLHRPELDSTIISMTDALALGDFHTQTVSVLAQRFILSCSERFEWQEPLKQSLQKHPVSQTERVLYRFEMFRRLFGRFCANELELIALAPSFFEKFAPWENAQLACIHDFLAREVSPTYNYVAQHDIVWGAYRVSDNGYGGGAIQHLLTLGLSKILEIGRSETFAEKSRLIGRGEMPGICNMEFLQEAFVAIYDPWRGDREVVDDMCDVPPCFWDGDDGPEDTWMLDCAEAVVFDGFDGKIEPRREWGYVLWDADRVDYLEIYEEHEKNPTSGSRERGFNDPLSTRFDIYERGDRGYWSADDESQIVWSELCAS